MIVLHVYRGYGVDLKNPVIDNQLKSLQKNNDAIVYDKFIISKGGIFEYLKSIFKLNRYIKTTQVDIIHAHYSFSGFLASLAFSRKPVICSLMGSDVLADKLFRIIIKFFIKYMWKSTIVKSKEMQKVFSNSIVIPNGVDLENFYPRDLEISYKKTGFDKNKINLIFISTDPNVTVKNISLAEKAIELLDKDKVVLHKLSSISFEDLPYYYSSANMLLLTSLSEGSPNVIKESMACNCPIVSTDVGDVKSLIKDIKGSYITTFDMEDVADKIQKVIDFGKKTEAREKIKDLDSNLISNKIIDLYKKLEI